MTEYWISKQSYYCKYCEIYIRDDKPSRAQHENGLRHKGNLERYIREIYKKEERINYEKEEEKRIIKKINDAAQASHESQDRQSSSSSKRLIEADEEELETNSKKVKGNRLEEWKGGKDMMNYSDAKSLGLINETEQIEINEENQTQKEIRMKEGFIGKWEISRPIPKSNPTTILSIKKEPILSNETIRSKLSNQFNSDLEPPSKLFSERKIETDFDPTKNLEIKVKKKTNVQLKEEEGIDFNKPILPFRLDGLQSEYSIEENPSNSVNLDQSKSDDDDVKPDLNRLDETKPLVEEETKVLFKKRKPKANSTLRQKS